MERAMSVTTHIDPSLSRVLIEASIESYYAFDSHNPGRCNRTKVTPPTGYDLVDCWTGIDTVFASFNQVECFGVVFRSQSAPYSYIFAFRGTYSILDALEDAEFWCHETFVPFRASAPSQDAKVAMGFWSIYTTSVAGTPSMQEQLFNLLDKYQSSAQPIHRLLVTGHSLGAALCELFTLDLALSPHQSIAYSNYNYACPQVGNAAFAQLYDSQPQEQDPATRTLRIQNTYDIVPCSPPTITGYQHVGDAYLVAFYNKTAGWLDPLAKLYDHQALNYQAVLECAFQSPDGICVNDNLQVPTDAETLVSLKPDPSTLCWFLAAQEQGARAAAAVDEPASVNQPVVPSQGP
ncbi:MAG: lipase family protein [Pseudonocardiaceae bacterium]